MTPTESPSILDAWSDNPAATAAAVAVGILVGATVTFGLVQILSTGDEPPIRVRNGGSVHLEVLHKNRHWNPDHDDDEDEGKKWKISKGEKLVDRYWLFLSPTNPGECDNKSSVDGNDFTFVVDDNTEIRVFSDDKKARIVSTKPLTRSGDKKTLSYGTNANYIKFIKVGTDTPCTFGVKDEKLHSLFTEYVQ